ncbi:MAG: Hsp20/alpha crystallin family protein [Candidatus Paceibacterota bacterium]
MQVQRRGNRDIQPREEAPLSLRDAMSRLFDESIWDPFEERGLLSDTGSRELFPKVDISETDKEVKIVASVPGIDPEKVNIEADEDSITLSGTIEEEKQDENERGYRYEREYGEFYRDLFLPAKVDPDNVSASAKDGVITINLPKAVDKDSRKKIDVKKNS